MHVAFTPLGIVVALTFVGLPFVVRTVQPVLASMAPEFEEAAQTLGASRGQTFVRVVGDSCGSRGSARCGERTLHAASALGD